MISGFSLFSSNDKVVNKYSEDLLQNVLLFTVQTYLLTKDINALYASLALCAQYSVTAPVMT